jgi:hypothetical protein
MPGRAVRWVAVSTIVVLGLTTGASAATARWSSLPLPTGHVPTPYQVSCASQRACFALAMYVRDPFVRYTGTHATRLAGPRIDDPAELNALDCPSASACFVLGETGRSAHHGLLALRWHNRHWSAMRLPALPGRSLADSTYQLGGLSCPSTRMCIATGVVQAPTAPTSTQPVIRPLLLRWNGRRWSSVRSPLTSGALRSVSCASATACTAVGFTATKSPGPAVLRLHAGHWTQVRFGPRASGVLGAGLTSISCPTANSCLATGVTDMTGPHDAVTRVVDLRQTRGGWSTTLPPLPRLPRGDHPNDLTDSLTALSCGAPGSCLGVGTWINDRGDGTSGSMSLAFRSTSPHPIAKSRAGSSPTSVSCPTTAFCLVAGNRSIRRYTP